jgi:catechol 2,3-dioxygenase-like lactoylglutathione lyase family enzyme
LRKTNKRRLAIKMIDFKRIDHVQLSIPKGKEDEARAFYTDILGLKEIPKPASLMPNGGLWYQAANIELHLGIEPEIITRRHPAFEIADVAAARVLLQDKVKIVEEPCIPGRTRFAFLDPFGNKIELLQML